MTFNPARLWRPVSTSAAVRAGLLAGVVASILWGCGGGVGSGGTGGFASTGFVSGPITGFGSVIVNGVRFDETSAEISDADGARKTRDQLRLGMTVEVESGAISTDSAGVSSAVAARIRVESELRGPVTAVDLAGSSFTLLGQRVLVTSTTLFDDSLHGGLAGLVGPGAPAAVEVYAAFDAASSSYRALRIDSASSSATLRLRGPVQQIDTAAQSVRVGNSTYAISALTQPPSGVAVGQIVRLQVQSSGSGNALSVKSWGSSVQQVSDTEFVKLSGVVSAFTSLANFSVDGRRVDGSAASISPGGASVALGARVDVEGPVSSGVLRASKLSVSNDSLDYDRGFDLSGSITAVTATGNPNQPSFVLRGQTINTSRPDLRYDNGSAALLTVGRSVEVKGVLSADRRSVDATRIKF